MSNYLGFKPSDNSRYFFVSYNNEDAGRVGPIAKALSDGGVSLWYDYGIEYGDVWDRTIAAKIRRSEAVILFFSRDILSKQKSFVQKEFKMATRSYSKKVYVVMMDDIKDHEVPDDKQSWWFDITDLQCINAFSISGTPALAAKIAQAIGETIQPQTPEQLSSKPVSTRADDKTKSENIFPQIDPAILDSPEAMLALQQALEDIIARRNFDNKPVSAVSKPERSLSEAEYSSDGLKYKLMNDSEVIITGCNGNLRSVRIPEMIDGKPVSEIDSRAFAGCSELEDITIPRTVKTIGYAAFQDCCSLKSVIIPDVEFIGHRAFSGCTGITRVVCPDSFMTSDFWRDTPFWKNRMQSSVKQNVSKQTVSSSPKTSVNSYTGKSSAKKDVIPPKVVRSGSHNPQYVKVHTDHSRSEGTYSSDGLEYIFNDDSEVIITGCIGNLQYVRIPETIDGKTVSEIDSRAFAGCSELEDIIIPFTVKTIGYAAFQDCTSLRSVIIPGIEFIGHRAFSGCTGISTVICPDPFLTSDFWGDTPFWKNRTKR